jgi:hypothetical protein
LEASQVHIGNLTKVGKINLGVNASAVHFAVPEQIADLFQRPAAIDKTCGAGMAKGVRSSWANGRSQELPVMSDDFKNSAAGKRVKGAAQSQKDLAKCFARSYFSQVPQDGCSNGGSRRKGLRPASLASPQVEEIVFPIDIFKAQQTDFTRTQPVDDQQHEDRPVTDRC